MEKFAIPDWELPTRCSHHLILFVSKVYAFNPTSWAIEFPHYVLCYTSAPYLVRTAKSAAKHAWNAFRA